MQRFWLLQKGACLLTASWKISQDQVNLLKGSCIKNRLRWNQSWFVCVPWRRTERDVGGTEGDGDIAASLACALVPSVINLLLIFQLVYAINLQCN